MENPFFWPEVDDRLDLADDQKQELSTDQESLNKIFVRCFATEEGQKVLEYLENLTLKQPIWQPEIGLMQAVPLGFSREGQNSIVREIKQRIAQGQSTPQKGA